MKNGHRTKPTEIELPFKAKSNRKLRIKKPNKKKQVL